MMSEQGYARVRGVLRRRRLWVVATATAVLAGSAIGIGALRPVYKAQVVLRALEAQPHKDYVAPTVTEQVGERLKTLRLAVMSRPILEQVYDDLHLGDAFHGRGRDDAVDAMRARMDVKVEGEDTFLLTYQDGDAVRAREVVNAVARRFVEHEVEQRQRIAAATEQALAGEVERLRPQLERLEGAMRDFKLSHYGSLPEQQEQNLRTLDQTTMELDIQATNLDAKEERRRQLLAGALAPAQHQEAQLESELHEALTRYTPDHPEVKRVEAELERVRGARVAQQGRLRAGVDGDPELSSLAMQVRRERGIVDGLRKRQDEVRARLADTAKNGQALLALSTDLDEVRTKYQAALGKLQDAQLARGVERSLRGLRYDTVETAATPSRPVRPNRPALALGALALALALGLAAGFARDFTDRSIHAPEELQTLGRPVEVLACVPEVES